MSFLKSLFGGKGGDGGLISIREFRDRFVAELRAGDPALKIEIVDDRTVKVGRPGGDEGTIFMQNTYAQYADDPTQLDFVIAKLTRFVIEASGGIQESADRMVLVARRVDYGREYPDAAILRPVAGDVGMLLAFDGAASLKAVGRGDLETLGLTEDAAFEKAAQVLRTRIGTLSQGSLKGSPLYFVAAESGLATGALTLPNMWGKPDRSRTVFVETKEMFLWAYSDDESAVAFLRGYARQRTKAYDTVSKTLIEFDGRVWTDKGLS